jgi:tetratricopeptide (TPR) repeat protein
MGDRDGEAKAYDTLGLIAYGRGDYAEARRCHESALAIHREQNSTYEEGNTLAMLALAQIGEGQPDAARTLAEQAREVARRTGAPQLEAEALSALAEADLAAADRAQGAEREALLARAAEAAAAAANLARRIGSKLDEGVALRLTGQITARREGGRTFVAHFEAALALFAATRSAFETARTEARLGEALAACNDPMADTYLLRAEETLRKIGAAGELRRLGRP